MAKGKRAAALFEVIQAAKAREEKRLNKARPAAVKSGGLLTPSWWFKSKKSNLGSAFSEPIVSREIPAEPPPIVTVSTPEKEVKRASLIGSLLARRKEKEDAEVQEQTQRVGQPEESVEPVQDVSEQTIEESSAVESQTQEMDQPAEQRTQPMMRLADDIVDNEEALDFAVETPAPQPKPTVSKPAVSQVAEIPAEVEPEAPAPERFVTEHKPVQLAVDRQRQQLSLRITYTSAAIGAFGFLAVVGMAFIIGRSVNHGPAMAGASSIDALRKGPAFPQVLMPAHNSSNPMADDGSTVKAPLKAVAKNVAPLATPASAKLTASPQNAPQPVAQQQSVKPATPPVFDGHRVVGMQYVWIQSYPDPEDANDAVAVLKKAGIDATAEKNLWIAPSWTTVIGTRAFDHTRNNPDYEAYLQSIQEVSENFAGKSKFKSFEPRPIGWKDQTR